MSIGAFAVVAARERELGVPVTLDNLGGLRLGAAVPRRRDVGLHARLHGHAADRRLRRQVLRLLGRVRVRLVVADRRRRGRDGGLALLLPRASCARCTCARPPSCSSAVAGGSPPRDPLLASAVVAALAVTVGSFFFVQPLIDLARDAAASLPLIAQVTVCRERDSVPRETLGPLRPRRRRARAATADRGREQRLSGEEREADDDGR